MKSALVNCINSFITKYDFNSESENRCKVKQRYLLDYESNPLKTVANYGLAPGDKAYVNRDGIYHGFTIEALENIHPIINENIVINSLKLIKKYISNNKSDQQKFYLKIARLLGINDHVMESGISAKSITYYGLDTWLEFNKFNLIFDKYYNKDEINSNITEKINEHIKRERHHPIKGRFKIINCGCNIKKKEPVVPIEWIGKTFVNGEKLHLEMDKLDSRKGEPPTMYCAVSSMSLLEENIWISLKDFTKKFCSKKKIVCYVVYLNDMDSIQSNRLSNMKNLLDLGDVINFEGFIHISNFEDKNTELWIGLDTELVNKNSEKISYAKIRDKVSKSIFLRKHIGSGSVGYMSSLVQKCFRRGNVNSTLLETTLQRLNKSVPYNLPDHGFALVSGTRQMLWRSFISIIEDVKGYVVDHISTSSAIDMRSLVLLSLISNTDPGIQISEDGMNIITNTMTTLQSYDELWDWRKYTEENNPKILYNFLDPKQKDNHYNQIKDAICLSMECMPMMRNDKKMLAKALSYVLDTSNYSDSLNCIKKFSDIHPNKNKVVFPKYIDKTIIGTCKGAMDMHCNPTMLITLQSMTNLDLNFDYFPELQRLGSFIWNNASRYNYRYNKIGITNIYSEQEIIYNLKKSGLSPKNKSYKFELTKHIKYINTLSKSILTNLDYLQKVLLLGRWMDFIDWVEPYPLMLENSETVNNDSKDNVGRIAWLILFGQTRSYRYRNRTYQIILSGSDSSEPCKIKKYNQKSSEYIEGELRDKIEESFLSDFKEETVRIYSLPNGYEWSYNKLGINKKSKTVQISYDSDKCVFTINTISVKPLNLKNLIKKTKHVKVIHNKIPPKFQNLIEYVFYVNNSNIKKDLIFKLNDVAYFRRDFEDYRIYDWSTLITDSDVGILENLKKIIRIVLARIYTSDIDSVEGVYTLKTGPCDRRGKKTLNSISYSYEGIIYRIFSFLEAMYPRIIIRKITSLKNLNPILIRKYGSSTTGKWTLNRESPEYIHMIDSLNSILDKKIENDNQIDLYAECKMIQSNTNPWDHQTKTVDRIYDGMIRHGLKGFGDASHVGAGKTLCALIMMSKLYNHNKIKANLKKSNHTGFLVMVPTNSLIDTWKDETIKHFTKKNKRFDILIHQANGSLLRYDYKSKKLVNLKVSNLIKGHTLVISTMGRIREHPFRHAWILTVIDECLSVQNKEALQTEEAWRQSCHSEYGILMLSATFFRSRFDKMLYMLKMLRSGLPEQRVYLDTILSEHVISNITESSRIWSTKIDRYELPEKQKIEYQNIYDKYLSEGSERLYTKLNDFIHNKVDYISIFFDTLETAESNNNRCVIFTKSKNEADLIYNHDKNKNIGRYPEKLNHTVLSLSEGTYGLNDLVEYDTLIMRPPEPDKLPQIKGRLDRPGQKSDSLNIRYVLLKDTIEEAGLVRLELCNRFYANYLMPLAEFYELAIKTDIHSKSKLNINKKVIKIKKNIE